MEKYREKQNIEFEQFSRGKRLKAKYLNWHFAAKVFGTLFIYVLLIGIAFVIVYPIIRRVSNAFKPAEEFFDSSVILFPRNPTQETIWRAYGGLNVNGLGAKSFWLAVFVALGQTAVATVAAYGFARFKFRGSKLLFACVIFTLVVPPETIVIPLLLRFRYFNPFGLMSLILGKPLDLTDTLWPQIILALTGMGWKNGLYIYMMREYFKGMPIALEEAAYIDGAKTMRAFFEIILPSAVPMMMTIFLFSFSWQWTDDFYAGTFLLTERVMATNIATLVESGSGGSVEIVSYNTQQTATLLLILPLIVLFIFTQRFFVEGIERSGITGT